MDKLSTLHEKISQKLYDVFKNKASGAVVYNASASDLKEYIRSNPNGFSKIVYAEYDRKKYLYNSDMRAPGLDTVLKKSLSRSFIEKRMKSDRIYVNYLSEFEKLLCENTLVVIDGYDVKSPTPYMRHLLSTGVFLVICAKHKMSGLPEHFSVIDVEKSNNCATENISLLDGRQKELLMTLCAMLYYLGDDTEIVSSKNGVFDKDSVKFYLGSLCEELECLEKYNLVSVTEKGRISIDDEICEYVFENLSPSSENCRTFMEFTDEICRFSVMQNYKDTYARLCVSDGEYNSFVSSEEFRDVYSYFVPSDKDRGHKVYNMMISDMLEENALQKGMFNCRHLLWRNRCFYLSVMAEYLRDEEKSFCEYDDDLYFDEPLCEIYSHTVKAELDIIRVCVTLIRNVTYDLYKETEYVFETLLGAMNRIYKNISEYDGDVTEKICVIDDVLRLCYETFSFAGVMSEDGKYNHFRNNMKNSRVFYACEKESDEFNACSVLMGYSKTTLALYKLYCVYISDFLMLTSDNNHDRTNKLLYDYNMEKRAVLEKVSARISEKYNSIVYGYENYTYCSNDRSQALSGVDFPEGVEKRLLDNERYLLRGFDGGTKTGAERYSEEIIKALEKSTEPLLTVLPILDSEYPLGEHTYRILREKNFVGRVCSHKSMSNLSKQMLLENLIIDFKAECDRVEYLNLYREFVLGLSFDVVHNETSLERMYRAASQMLVKAVLQSYTAGIMTDVFDLSKVVYEKYCIDKKYNEKYCDDYLAQIMYDVINQKDVFADAVKLKRALDVFVFENGHVYDGGIYVFLQKVYGNTEAEKIFAEIENAPSIM